jgi:hypothetical protein
MRILLQPMTAKNVATRKEIDTGQDRIFLDGQHVGYVRRKEDSPISLIVTDLSDEAKLAIDEAVRQQYGGDAREIGQPVEIPEDYATDMDTEDEGYDE